MIGGGWAVAYITLITITLLACGFLAGWLARGDANDDDRLDHLEAQLTVKGRHAQSRPKRLASTGEITAAIGDVTANIPVRHSAEEVRAAVTRNLWYVDHSRETA